MKGKAKCKILREIRRKIAEENDIELITKDCTYQGECRGTCPKCEAEVRFLEQELEKRKQLGKAVTVAALAASLTVGLTACVPKPLTEKTETTVCSDLQGTGCSTDATETMGEPTLSPDDTEDLWPGEVPRETEDTEIYELEGDVAYITEMTDAE